MPETITEAVGEKIQELHTKSTCKGDLSQEIILTTEDKIKIAVNDYQLRTKFVFDWPNHLTSIITLIVSLVSMPDNGESKVLGVTVETWKYLISFTILVFTYMLVRSVVYRIKNRGCISTESLINSLSRSKT